MNDLTSQVTELQEKFNQLTQDYALLHGERNKLKTLNAHMVSEFRHLAKTAEDLAKQMYDKASEYEGKGRNL